MSKGVISRGIPAPLIKEGDNIMNIVVESVLKETNGELNDMDIIGVTESAVARAFGQYVTTDDIAKDNALKLTDEAVVEMRNVAHHLMPDSLKRYGLHTALSNFCMSVPTVSFTFVGKEHRLPKAKEEAIYYIVHELVNNAAKNAHANNIHVQLIMNEGYTAVNVSDNGQGLPEQTESLRFGMQGIEQRVKAIDGLLDIYSKPGEGTEVNIEIKE